MALPKRRQSKSRSKRRTHYKSGLVSTTTCAQCGATKMPHRACLVVIIMRVDQLFLHLKY